MLNYFWIAAVMRARHLEDSIQSSHLNGNLMLNDVQRCIRMEYYSE